MDSSSMRSSLAYTKKVGNIPTYTDLELRVVLNHLFYFDIPIPEAQSPHDRWEHDILLEELHHNAEYYYSHYYPVASWLADTFDDVTDLMFTYLWGFLFVIKEP